MTKWKSKDFLASIIFLQFLVYATIFFDVPIARQVVGFLYLTFVPGIIVIRLLKLYDLERSEIVLFSAGFSIAFLMLTGLLVNEFGLLLGVSQPLSTISLTVILNGFILVGGVSSCLRSGQPILLRQKPPKLSVVLSLGSLIALSVIGAVFANAFGSNLILLLMIISISFLFAIGVMSRKLLPPKYFTIALFVIALSLLYHNALISNHMVTFASDVPLEYFVFRTTQTQAYWNSTNPYVGNLIFGRYQSMLSITILPTIYSGLLNIDSTWTFRTLYPLLFALVPVGLYQIWQMFVGKKYAFVSTFFFVSLQTFYTEMLSLNRQIVAELFFVLLLFTILNKKVKPVQKTMIFIIFSIGLVTSHYALAEILMLFISLAFISAVFLKRPSGNITASMILFFFVVMFSWYIYTSRSAGFDSILYLGNSLYEQLGEFSNPASRGQTVLRGLGMEAAPSVWNTISRAFAYATQLLIVIGFFGMLKKRRTMSSSIREYFTFASIAIAFLSVLILVPGLANSFNITRFYHVLIFFLAPLCIIGVEVIVKLILHTRSKLISKHEELIASVLLLTVLIPYFLFQTNFVYEVVAGSESWSIALSKHQMEPFRLYCSLGYIDDCSVFGAQWLSKNVNMKSSQLYADLVSENNALTIYGMIYRGNVNTLYNTTSVAGSGTVYLNRFNVECKKIVGHGGYVWNFTELSFDLTDFDKVYTNGGNEVYRNPP